MNPQQIISTQQAPGLFGAKPTCHSEGTPYGSFDCQSSLLNRENFRAWINKYKDDDGIFCEIGVFGGINLFSLYDYCKERNMKIIGIDPHDKIEIFNGVNKDNIDNNITEPRYTLWKKNRVIIEKTIKKFNLDINYINHISWNAYKLISDKTINVLHIDGDHSYEGVTKDLNLFFPKMKDKSVIILDDIKWVGIRTAADEFCDKNNLKLNVYEHWATIILDR